jgi:hypothetical protein
LENKIFWDFCQKKIFLECLIIPSLPYLLENKEFFVHRERGNYYANYGSPKKL